MTDRTVLAVASRNISGGPWKTASGPQPAGRRQPRQLSIAHGPWPLHAGQKVGGIDFGFRNPFAAIWGVVDRDGVLWLCGEHYQRQQPLSWHVRHLPRDATWYADPSGAEQITELRCADFVVRRGNNAVQMGIAAIHARLAAGTLRVVQGRCPNLLAEAGLYRFSEAPDDRKSEEPISAHNHALDALRYLISRLDAHKMALDQPAGERRDDNEEVDSRRPCNAAERADDERMGGQAG